jgi:hypothetical protein
MVIRASRFILFLCLVTAAPASVAAADVLSSSWHAIPAFLLGGNGNGASSFSRRQRSIKTRNSSPSSSDTIDPQQQQQQQQQQLSAQEQHMSVISSAVHRHIDTIISGLVTHGIATIPQFLPPSTVATLRAESNALYYDYPDKQKDNGQDAQGQQPQGQYFVRAQSSKWDESTKSLVRYDKHNVQSTQLLGGDMYHDAPRLTETVVQLTSTLIPLLNNNNNGDDPNARRFPDEALLQLQLAPGIQTNKLAICLGDGSRYDKHLDNEGGVDLRKVTCLLYLNEYEWTEELGGVFRWYKKTNSQEMAGLHEDIPPTSGRLVCFFSDRLVHEVTPSFVLPGKEEETSRHALTIWLLATSADAIEKDEYMERLHFG